MALHCSACSELVQLARTLRGPQLERMPESMWQASVERTCCCRYELLTRTADGNEGGRQQLLTATVGNGNLYICKVQIGDKRWFKGELAPSGSVGCHTSRMSLL